jgi:F0F1-type ATP synthase assembly protein I
MTQSGQKQPILDASFRKGKYMSWTAAFMSSWYPIAYALGAVFLLYGAWRFSKMNFASIRVLNYGIVKLVKLIVIIILFIIAGSFFYGAYQVTAFTHYLSIKKMAPI